MKEKKLSQAEQYKKDLLDFFKENKYWPGRLMRDYDLSFEQRLEIRTEVGAFVPDDECPKSSC